MSTGPSNVGQQFTTASGGHLSPADAQAAAERGYKGVMPDAPPEASAEAQKPLSKETVAYMRNQYNLLAAGLQPGQREYAERVLKPTLEANGVKV